MCCSTARAIRRNHALKYQSNEIQNFRIPLYHGTSFLTDSLKCFQCISEKKWAENWNDDYRNERIQPQSTQCIKKGKAGRQASLAINQIAASIGGNYVSISLSYTQNMPVHKSLEALTGSLMRHLPIPLTWSNLLIFNFIFTYWNAIFLSRSRTNSPVIFAGYLIALWILRLWTSTYL